MKKEQQEAEQILSVRRAYEECRTFVTESDLDFYLRYKFRFILIYIALILLCAGGMVLMNSQKNDIHSTATIMIPILVFSLVQNKISMSRLQAQVNALHKMRELEKANQSIEPYRDNVR